MFYWLAEFSDGGGVLNLFRYISFRAGMAQKQSRKSGLSQRPYQPEN
jgi:hypothetical protein